MSKEDTDHENRDIELTDHQLDKAAGGFSDLLVKAIEPPKTIPAYMKDCNVSCCDIRWAG